MGLIWTGVVMGIGGTAAMDVWAMVLNKLAGQPKPNWANPGRWFAHLFRGRVFHDDIAKSAPVSGELALGWAFHYLVGIIYGAVFVLLVGPGWLAEPTFVPVWIWGLLTIAGGWCLLHPGMGLGWFLSRTPRPWKGRAMGLVAHTVFALGMWGVALAV